MMVVVRPQLMVAVRDTSTRSGLNALQPGRRGREEWTTQTLHSIFATYRPAPKYFGYNMWWPGNERVYIVKSAATKQRVVNPVTFRERGVVKPARASMKNTTRYNT